MTVLPRRLTTFPPRGAAISPRLPTAVNRPFSTTNAASSIGARPSPSIKRAPSKSTAGAVVCASITGDTAEKPAIAAARANNSAATRCAGLFGKTTVELLILETHEFDQLGVDEQPLIHAHRPRFRVRLGIVDGDVDLQRAEVGPAESLGQLSSRRQRRAVDVEPYVIAEVRRLDDERVAVPAASRIAKPPRLRIVGRRRAAVHEDLAQAGVGFVDDDDDV